MSETLVIVGLGYVGLPLVIEAVRAGFAVTGLDTNHNVVACLQSGRSHVDDIDDCDILDALERGFVATDDPSVVGSADVVVICVPTPLSRDGGPDLSAVVAVADSLGPVLKNGALVVLESTTWPGTTEEILRPRLEASGMRVGRDFFLAFSPERIDPGNKRYGLKNTPKIVGGVTADCTRAARAFYAKIVETVVVAAGTREAEMAKLLENTYRHINIALVNEMAKFSHELEIDLWDVIRCAATKPFGFQAFYPGPGVGGHCIPIDPNYLSHRVRAELGYPFRFVELAQEVNQSMPQYVLRRAQDALNERGLALNGSRVLLLGVTYKADIRDERESPAQPLGAALLRAGADLSFHDPLVTSWDVGGQQFTVVDDLQESLLAADIAILLQPHAAYATALRVPGAHILDTRGVLTGEGVVRL